MSAVIRSYADLEIPQRSTKPSLPITGFWKIYPKPDGNIYILDSSGIESIIGGGGINVPSPPPSGTSNVTKYFYGDLGTGGFKTGNTDQNVNGSVTPVTFYISSSLDYDIYIYGIVVIIKASAITNNRFGNITASSITNGWNLRLIEGGVTTYVASSIKTVGQALSTRPPGSGITNELIPSFDGNSDAQRIIYDIAHNKPDGLRLGRGNNDRFESIISDNFTSLIGMVVSIYGYQNYPSI